MNDLENDQLQHLLEMSTTSTSDNSDLSDVTEALIVTETEATQEVSDEVSEQGEVELDRTVVHDIKLDYSVESIGLDDATVAHIVADLGTTVATSEPPMIKVPVLDIESAHTLSKSHPKVESATAAPEAPAATQSAGEVFDQEEPMEEAGLGNSYDARPETVKEYVPYLNKEGVGDVSVLQLPANSLDVTMNHLSRAGAQPATTGEKLVDWVHATEESITYLPLGAEATRRLDEEEAGWAQGVEHRGAVLRAKLPPRKSKPGAVVIEGPQAVAAALTHLGIGGSGVIPLWNSGFYVQFLPPQVEARFSLNMIMAMDKVRLGRESYSLAHSHRSVYIRERVFEMALNHVATTSVRKEELPIAKLRDYIKPQDLESFIWGFLLTMYPSGFQMERPCISDASKCNHIFRGTINLAGLQIVASNELTDAQKNHMSAVAANSRTLESVIQYQESITSMHKERFVLFPGSPNAIAITLKTPTMTEMFESGHFYINGIVDAVTKALGEEVGSAARNEEMERLANATALGQYSHYVEMIELGDVENEGGDRRVIENPETILNILKGYSQTESLRVAIIEKVLRYIYKSSLSMIALRAHDCPVCKTNQAAKTEETYPQFKSYVPLDIYQVFFGLHGLLMNRLQ